MVKRNTYISSILKLTFLVKPMCNLYREVREVVERLKAKLRKTTFIKAVGKSTCSDIELLINFVEKDFKECNVRISTRYIINLFDKYLVLEGKVKFLLKELLRIVLRDYIHDLEKLYPLLPDDIKQVIEKYVSDVKYEVSDTSLIDNIIGLVMSNFDSFREEFQSLIKIVRDYENLCKEFSLY